MALVYVFKKTRELSRNALSYKHNTKGAGNDSAERQDCTGLATAKGRGVKEQKLGEIANSENTCKNARGTETIFFSKCGKLCQCNSRSGSSCWWSRPRTTFLRRENRSSKCKRCNCDHFNNGHFLFLGLFFIFGFAFYFRLPLLGEKRKNSSVNY